MRFKIAQCRDDGFGILADPSIVDEPDRDGMYEVQFLAAAFTRYDEAGVFENREMLHYAEARHRKTFLERAYRLMSRDDMDRP